MSEITETTRAIQIARDLISDLWAMRESRLKRGLARDAASLAFWRDGMWAPVQRIAEGRGSAQDLTEIERKYRQSHASVAAVTRRFDAARQRLTGLSGGFDLIQKLETLLYAPAMKWQIRRGLADLVEKGEFDTAEAQANAGAILADIERFNAGLASLHRELFAGAAKA